MKFLRSHIVPLLSAVMLLVFSGSQLPLDLLHGHQDKVHVSASEGICLHKGHLQKTQVKCVLSLVHVDNAISPVASHFDVKFTYVTTDYTERSADIVYTARTATSLRGPPAC